MNFHFFYYMHAYRKHGGKIASIVVILSPLQLLIPPGVAIFVVVFFGLLDRNHSSGQRNKSTGNSNNQFSKSNGYLYLFVVGLWQTFS